MTAAYEKAQKQLSAGVAELEQIIENAKIQASNIYRILALVKRNTDITELDAEIIRIFVNRIVVYHADNFWVHRRQYIDVEFIFWGR